MLAGVAALAIVPAIASARGGVRCDTPIQHPLAVKVSALDPVRRGEIIRVRVTTTSRHDLERGEVKLVHAGGASLAGPARVALGRLAAGRAAASDFAVRLPSEGRRFLLQFRVTGEGDSGLDARGATLNLLPDGPADPGRIVTSESGRRIAEYRAGRIGR
jgi:hypothetical protein